MSRSKNAAFAFFLTAYLAGGYVVLFCLRDSLGQGLFVAWIIAMIVLYEWLRKRGKL